MRKNKTQLLQELCEQAGWFRTIREGNYFIAFKTVKEYTDYRIDEATGRESTKGMRFRSYADGVWWLDAERKEKERLEQEAE